MSRIEHSGALRQREPRIRDKPYLGWVKDLPCIACAVRGVIRRGVEAAHCKIGFPDDGWRAFGHAEKSHDWRATPLCTAHHREGEHAQHNNRGGDERAYWERLEVHPPEFCAALYAAFQAGDNGDAVVHKFAAAARAKLATRRAAGNL